MTDDAFLNAINARAAIWDGLSRRYAITALFDGDPEEIQPTPYCVFACSFGRAKIKASGGLLTRGGIVEITAFHPHGKGAETMMGEMMARAMAVLECDLIRTVDHVPIYFDPASSYGPPIRVPEAPTWLMQVGSVPFWFFEFLEQTAKDLVG